MELIAKKLTPEERASMDATLAESYFDFVVEADRHLNTFEENKWLPRMSDAHDELLAALDWYAGKSGQAERELELSLLLVRLWDMSGDYGKAEPRIVHALARQTTQNDPLHALAYARLGLIAYRQARYATAKEYVAKALSMGRNLPDAEPLVLALNVLGRVQRAEGDLSGAKSSFLDALDHAKKANLLKRVGWSLRGLGEVAADEGDYEAAWSFHHQSLEIQESIGNVREIAAQLDSLSLLSLQAGDFDQAIAQNDKAMMLRLGGGNRNGVAQCHYRRGLIEEKRNDVAAAKVHFEKAAEIYGEIGNPVKEREARDAVERVAKGIDGA